MREEAKYTEKTYWNVVAASRMWTPTRTDRKFGVSSIQAIEKMPFLAARAILARMEVEGLRPIYEYGVPKEQYDDFAIPDAYFYGDDETGIAM
jgi:hypothetical protein